MEYTSKLSFLDGVFCGVSNRYWVLYAYVWVVQAFGMTLLSLFGHFHFFSQFYGITCGRLSICLWGAAPGIAMAAMSILCLKRRRKGWTDVCVSVVVVVVLWLLGGYVKTYTWMSERFYVEQSTGIYHLIDDCENAQGNMEEVLGSKVVEKGYKLCTHCEEMAKDAEFLWIRH